MHTDAGSPPHQAATATPGALLAPHTWWAFPMQDSTDTPDRADVQYGITGDYDVNDLLIEISGEHSHVAADFIITAAQHYTAHQQDSALAGEGARTLPDQAQEADLVTEIAATRTELARGDTKAGILIGFTTGLLSVLVALVALAPALAVAIRVGLVVAVALLTAGTATAIYSMIRPTLPPIGQGTGFVAHAACSDPGELLARLAADPKIRKAEEVIRLSKITYGKYGRLRLASDLVLAALAVMVVSLPLGAL